MYVVRQQWAFSGCRLVVLVNFIWHDYYYDNDDDDDDDDNDNDGNDDDDNNENHNDDKNDDDDFDYFHNHCPKPNWPFPVLVQGVLWHASSSSTVDLLLL